MNLCALVVSQPQASAEVRERLENKISEIKKNFSEAAILSTCHRFEIYLPNETPPESLRKSLVEITGLTPSRLAEASRSFAGLKAAEHLFRVAAGLESAVIGENEILGQVRACLEQGSGVFSRELQAVFEVALRAGKKVRTQTSLARGSSSLASAALRLIQNRIPKALHKKTRVLLLGSGEMASRVALLLKDRDFSNLRVASRSPENAEQLAVKVGGSSHGLEEIANLLCDADVVVSLLSHSPNVLRESMFGFLESGKASTLLLLDMALPRNAEPALRQRPGLELFDIDDLARAVNASREHRREEIAAAEALIEEDLHQFSAALDAQAFPAHRRRLRNLRRREALLSEEEAFEPASISAASE